MRGKRETEKSSGTMEGGMQTASFPAVDRVQYAVAAAVAKQMKNPTIAKFLRAASDAAKVNSHYLTTSV